jgi:hypothetical protein
MGVLEHQRCGASGTVDREAAAPKDRQVDEVVAHVAMRPQPRCLDARAAARRRRACRRRPGRQGRSPRFCARLDARELRLVMIASRTPLACSIFSPCPSRTSKAFNFLAGVGIVELAVGQHAVDVERREADRLRGRL